MRKIDIPGRNGYDIPAVSTLKEGQGMIVVATHGFGSNKQATTYANLAKRLPAEEIGLVSYDQPAHGESPADGTGLRVELCMNDLEDVLAYVREQAPEAKIVQFGSSFGAYINLLYAAKRAKKAPNLFMRSAAVRMHEIMLSISTEDDFKKLMEDGYLDLEYYDRPIRMTKEFFEDLKENDLFELYHEGAANLFLLHGSADETAPVKDAIEFHERFGGDMYIVEGGDHSLTIPGAADKGYELLISYMNGGIK